MASLHYIYEYMERVHDIIFINGQRTEKCPTSAGVYGWRNNANGKWYVGNSMSIGSRMYHYKSNHFSGQLLFFRAVAKYGLVNFTCYKLMDCCPSKVSLNFWERFWVKEKDSFGENGYNLTIGGSGPQACSSDTREKLRVGGLRRRHSEATKEKIRINGNRGRKFGPRTEEFKIKMRTFYANVGVSEKTRELMKSAHTGRRHSEETICKMKESAKLRWKNSKENFKNIGIKLLETT
jgi:group I intron endonuclease